MKNKILTFLAAICIFTAGCSKKSSTDNDYDKGKITILTDDSFKSVTEALAEAYMINYPEAKIKVQVKKEDLGFLDLLHEKAKLIVMSRDLSKEEISEYRRITGMKFQPAKFAADAVIFVVPKNSVRDSISKDEILAMLNNPSKPLIFDGTNSGNLNFVAQVFHKQPKDLQFSVIDGNEQVVEQLGKYPDKIGVISLNTVSRPFGTEAEKLRSMVKILKVVDKGKNYEASPENLRDMTYPFTRVLYFLANEGNFQIANGIMRYSCTHLGQMVVQKEGLQPYNLYRREVQMR